MGFQKVQQQSCEVRDLPLGLLFRQAKWFRTWFKVLTFLLRLWFSIRNLFMMVKLLHYGYS